MKKYNKNHKAQRSYVDGLMRMLPSIITLTAFSCGITSIRVAIDGNLEMAVGLLVLSGYLDMIDGRVARLIGKSSKIGAELDSLSDLVCFGVAPGLISYIFVLKDIHKVGWALSLFYILCCAFRLAKFNVLSEESPGSKNHFSGLPAPGGATLALLPMKLFIASGEGILQNKWLVAIFTLVSAICMVSRFKVANFKHVNTTKPMMMRYMLAAALVLAGYLTLFWWTQSLLSVIYICCIPIMNVVQRRNGRKL